MIDVRMFTVGPVQENCFFVRAATARPRADRRPRRRGRRGCCRRVERARASTRRGDPAHPHPLRPRRRGRAGRAGDRRARLLPRARARGAGQHHGLRAVAGLRPVRELRGRPHGRRRRDAGARRLRRSTCSSPPATAPATSPTRSRDEARAVLRRRAVPGLGRPRRPARRRLADAAASIESLLDEFPAETTVYPGHMGADDARPRARDEPVPARARATVSRAHPGPARARSTCCPTTRRAASVLGAPGRAGSSAPPATGASRRRRSRRPSCSPAAWARPPTSSRRRCTRSRTAAGAR